MDTTLLFSPSRGFWSQDKGWVSHLGYAEQIAPEHNVVIGFRNTPDVRRIHLKKAHFLEMSGFYHWLISLASGRRDLNKLLLDVAGVEVPSEKDAQQTLANTLASQCELHSRFIAFAQEHTQYDTWWDKDTNSVFMVPSTHKFNVERAPYIPPHVPDFLYQRELRRQRQHNKKRR